MSSTAALARNAGLDVYLRHLANPPESFMIHVEFLAGYIDFHPWYAPLWHRTRAVDFRIVI
ncbi:uncharacterized protein PG986_004278 [Apiospora aurea]|uniref:Uncharacterized protein n=1 Tax=Apiospora aurea TaxID=335848 RepID=A0ABR1QNQ0_9PEZI